MTQQQLNNIAPLSNDDAVRLTTCTRARVSAKNRRRYMLNDTRLTARAALNAIQLGVFAAGAAVFAVWCLVAF